MDRRGDSSSCPTSSPCRFDRVRASQATPTTTPRIVVRPVDSRRGASFTASEEAVASCYSTTFYWPSVGGDGLKCHELAAGGSDADEYDTATPASSPSPPPSPPLPPPPEEDGDTGNNNENIGEDYATTLRAPIAGSHLLERRRKSGLRTLHLQLPPPASPASPEFWPDCFQHQLAAGSYYTLPGNPRAACDDSVAVSECLLREVTAAASTASEPSVYRAAEFGDAIPDTDASAGGTLVAVRGVPSSVADSEVLTALSALGTVVGGIRRIGSPKNGDGAAGDGDPGGGAGASRPGEAQAQSEAKGEAQGAPEERVARLLLWPQPREIPPQICVGGVIADVRVLSDQEAALLNLNDFESRSEDMRDKSLRSAAVTNKPFRSQIQVRLRSPGRAPRLVPAPSPPSGRRPSTRGRTLCAATPGVPSGSHTLPALSARPLAAGMAPALVRMPLDPAARTHVLQTAPGFHTGSLRRPSTPFPVLPRAIQPGLVGTASGSRPTVPGAPLSAVSPAGPAGHRPAAAPPISCADLPIATMPIPIPLVSVPVQGPAKGVRVPTSTDGIPVVLPVAPGTALGPMGTSTAVVVAAPVAAVVQATPAADVVCTATTTTSTATTSVISSSGSAPATPAPLHRHVLGPQESGSASSINNNASNEATERSQHSDSRPDPGPTSLSVPPSPAASPSTNRRPTKRLLQRKQSSQLDEPSSNGSALAPSPATRRKMLKHKAHADPATPPGAASGPNTAPPSPSGAKGRTHAGDVSQSSSSGQESPNKSERRRRVSILRLKSRRPPSPPVDAILSVDHTTTASERERTNSASSRDSRVSNWNTSSSRRRLSSVRRESTDSGKVPWCGCWGNGCI